MRVGLDIGPLVAPRTGVGNYCHSLLMGLLSLESGTVFKGFSSGLRRVAACELSGLALRRHIALPTRALYAIWNTLHAPKVDGLLGGVDVYHATNYFLPPTAVARRVLTLYDLAFLVKPHLCSPRVVGPFSRNARRFAADADAIITCSESTKEDIVRLLNVAPEKVAVAYGAVDASFVPVEREEAASKLAQRYGIRGPILLFVGTLEPRKNVVGLVRAFSRLACDLPHNLVLVGATGWDSGEIFREIGKLGLTERVIRPGFVPPNDLPLFYSAADVFVFPSHYEGFGLPILEAMAAGCPVVAGNNSSLPEVLGDAGILVHSEDTHAIASAVSRVVQDAGLREDMSLRGKERARRFSWDAAARVTLDVYRRAAAC